MAENIQETKPPEPPPKPPEIPKPTEQKPNDSETSAEPQESQHSAQQDARNAASSEHARATRDPEPEGLRPTPEFQSGLDEHSAAKDGPEGLQPTTELQEKLGAHTAAVAERNAGTPQDSAVPATPDGEQVGEHAVARETAETERARAAEGATDPAEGRHDPNRPAEQNNPQPEPAEHSTADEPESPAAGTVEDPAPPGDEPAIDETGDNQPDPAESGYTGPDRRQYEAKHLDPAADLRNRTHNAPEDNAEADESAETASRLNELRDEGHGPQRHHDPTDQQLAARMGDPILDPQTGRPELKGNGHVKAKDHIDPMNGEKVDAVTGDVHRCGNYATRFDSAEDYVAADRFMRDLVGESGQTVVNAPISDVLGPAGHDRMTGYYHDPANPGQLKPVDFTDGNIRAVYNRDENGDLALYTMYPDPVPFHPNQPGGTEQ